MRTPAIRFLSKVVVTVPPVEVKAQEVAIAPAMAVAPEMAAVPEVVKALATVRSNLEIV